MDKLTDKLNNISIHHAPTPKLLRSGKNRLENGNNQKIKKSTATSSSNNLKSTAEAISSNSSTLAFSKSTNSSSYSYATTELKAPNVNSTMIDKSFHISPPEYSDLSESDLFFDDDDLEESFILKPPDASGHKPLLLTTTKFGKFT